MIRLFESMASKNEARELIDFEMQIRNYDPSKSVITSPIDSRIEANAEP